MSDRWAVALAFSAAVGAVASRPMPLWLGVVLVLVALAGRRPALLCLGAVVLCSSLGARSHAGLRPPEPGTPVRAHATLVTDPVDVDGALRAELRLGSRRVEAWARGSPASALRPLLAGETVEVAGRLSAVPARSRAYLVRRHVAARLTVTSAEHPGAGGAVARLANDVRRTLLRGTTSFGDSERALFAGFVLGDDRDQDPVSVDDFRAAGLTHLLAVSGQNVAFVLALAAPVLRFLGLRGRLIAGVLILFGFGVLTRWEPSVLRASMMAAVTLLAATLGRPASTLRVLALAVTVLLVIDPLLVGSVGFLLSCGACAGIAVLAGPLSRRMPMALAVTVAAQVGVAPVLVPVFGGLPVASIPANLLAVPAAGPVMVWGLVAGLPAGLLGEPIATVVHLPNRSLVRWIAGVARWAASLPLGQLGAGHVVALCVLAAVAWRRRLRPAAAALAVLVCLLPMVRPGPPADGRSLGGDAQLWRDGAATVLVVGRPRPGPLLGALRMAGVRGISVVALASPSRSAKADLDTVLTRHRAGLVLTPADTVPGAVVTAGRLRVIVRSTAPRLVVEVGTCARERPCPPAGDPPLRR
ncbi:MAG TPA: ComEC/Rec2 family competence protein [Acidimicrobiales bacterium]|nr:ComEC/Rec2 family competence protein [Acidimicrobiales bacterium]